MITRPCRVYEDQCVAHLRCRGYPANLPISLVSRLTGVALQPYDIGAHREGRGARLRCVMMIAA